MKQYLFNPFERYSEIKLVVAGLIATVTGSILAYYAGGRYDGVIDFHLSPDVQFIQPFIDNTVNVMTLFMLLYIVGSLINKKTRAIDVLNTTLIARIPLYLLPLSGFSEYNRSIEDKILKSVSESPQMPVPDLTGTEYAVLVLIAIVGILCLIWFIILLYNGFKTASNLKTVSHKVYFALSILIAEIISKIIFSSIN